MVLVARQLQTLEQCGKVNVPLARVEMHLSVAQVVGQAHLTNARGAKGIQKTVDTFRHQMRMINSKRPAKMWRSDGVEIVATFCDRVPQVVYLGSSGFKIEIFEQ